MSLYYKLYESNREATKGKWYARPAITGTVTTDELAESIQEKCALHTADVKACIAALITEIKRGLQSSSRVTLDGLGTFKLGIRSKGAASRKEFSVEKNIKSVHVIFQPTVKIDSTTKTRTRALTTGTTLKELSPYNVAADDDSAASSSGSSTGSDSQGSSTGGDSQGTSTGGGDQQG